MTRSRRGGDASRWREETPVPVARGAPPRCVRRVAATVPSAPEFVAVRVRPHLVSPGLGFVAARFVRARFRRGSGSSLRGSSAPGFAGARVRPCAVRPRPVSSVLGSSVRGFVIAGIHRCLGSSAPCASPPCFPGVFLPGAIVRAAPRVRAMRHCSAAAAGRRARRRRRPRLSGPHLPAAGSDSRRPSPSLCGDAFLGGRGAEGSPRSMPGHNATRPRPPRRIDHRGTATASQPARTPRVPSGVPRETARADRCRPITRRSADSSSCDSARTPMRLPPHTGTRPRAPPPCPTPAHRTRTPLTRDRHGRPGRAVHRRGVHGRGDACHPIADPLLACCAGAASRVDAVRSSRPPHGRVTRPTPCPPTEDRALRSAANTAIAPVVFVSPARPARPARFHVKRRDVARTPDPFSPNDAGEWACPVSLAADPGRSRHCFTGNVAHRDVPRLLDEPPLAGSTVGSTPRHPRIDTSGA
ncbi:hypothetical protein TSOC111612_22025 [Tsukamurella ocularis]